MLRVTLNDNVFNDPKGFGDLDERLYYSKELSGFIIEIIGAVTFTGAAYDWLRTQLINDLCTEVIMSVDEDGFHLFKAKIFLTQVEWLPQTHEAECELVYEGYMSKIDHNKKIKCTINVDRSKNDTPIFVNPQTNFRVPDIDNILANDNTNKRGVYLFDAFKTLVEFMTDGEVSFVSDYFDYTATTPTQASMVMICTGKALRENAFATFPTISFDELYKDCNRIYNLSFSYEETSTGNFIRIEPKLYYKKETQSAHLGDVKGVVQKLNETSFPALVTFGSAKIAKDKTYIEEYRFLTMEEEEYHLGGQCNTDTVLGLKLDTLITDPNIIQDVVPSGTSNNNYEKDVFLICLDPDDTNRGLMAETPTMLGDYYINSFITNEKVALRWFTDIPISIYAFLGSGGNGCFVGSALPMVIYDETMPLLNSAVFRPEVMSGGGYHNVLANYVLAVDSFPNNYSVSHSYPLAVMAPMNGGFYYAPFSLVYNFEAEIFFEVATWARVYAIVVNPITGLVEQDMLLASQLTIDPPEVQVGTGLLNPQDNIHHIQVSGTVYMAAGWYLGLGIDWIDEVNATSTLEVFDPLGGRWVTYDEKDNFLMVNHFDYDIDRERWRNIKANANDVVGFDMGDGVNIGSWLNDIQRNIRTGKAELALNSKL